MTSGQIYCKGMSPREHIEALRASMLNTTATGYVKYTNRIIQGLSDAIYTDATSSWIYEILQNIRDAQLENQDQKDSFGLVRITLLDTDPFLQGDGGCVILSWNESGFSWKHVESLCAVGSSTKVSRTDLVGHKGIGFKAVFSVATAATILSKPTGYYFQLNANEDCLQFVTPVWIDPTSIPEKVLDYGNLKNLSLMLSVEDNYKTPMKFINLEHPTILCLSLKSNAFSACESIFTDSLKIISPETFLFLSKPNIVSFEVKSSSIHTFKVLTRETSPVSSTTLNAQDVEYVRIKRFIHCSKNNNTTQKKKKVLSESNTVSEDESPSPYVKKRQRDVSDNDDNNQIMSPFNIKTLKIASQHRYLLTRYQPSEMLAPITVAVNIPLVDNEKKGHSFNLVRINGSILDNNNNNTSSPHQQPLKKKMKWDKNLSRFIDLNSNTNDNIDDITSIEGMRPYMYSGLPVISLRHGAPWSIDGMFALTSNREAVQDAYVKYIPEALFESYRVMQQIPSLRYYAVSCLPTFKLLTQTKYQTVLRTHLTEFVERLQHEPVVPVGFDEDNVEWRLGLQTTRLPKDFLIAFLKLIDGYSENLQPSINTLFIRLGLILPNVILQATEYTKLSLNNLNVPFEWSPAELLQQKSLNDANRLSLALAEKIAILLSSPVAYWALQQLVTFHQNSNHSYTGDQYCYYNLKKEAFSICLKWLSMLCTKPSYFYNTPSDLFEPYSDHYDSKICLRVRTLLNLPIASLSHNISSIISRPLQQFVYLPESFLHSFSQKKIQDVMIPISQLQQHQKESNRRLDRACRTKSCMQITKTVRCANKHHKNDKDDPMSEPPRSPISNRRCRTKQQYRSLSSPKKSEIEHSSSIENKSTTVVGLTLEMSRIDDGFIQSLHLLPTDVHPTFFLEVLQPSTNFCDKDHILLWLAFGLKLKTFSIMNYIKDLAIHYMEKATHFTQLKNIQSGTTGLSGLIKCFSMGTLFSLIQTKTKQQLTEFGSILGTFPLISKDGKISNSMEECYMVPCMETRKDLSAGFLPLTCPLQECYKTLQQQQHTVPNLPWPTPILHDGYLLDIAEQFNNAYKKRWKLNEEDDLSFTNPLIEYKERIAQALGLIDLCDASSSPNGNEALHRHRQFLQRAIQLRFVISEEEEFSAKHQCSQLAQRLNITLEQASLTPVWLSLQRHYRQFLHSQHHSNNGNRKKKNQHLQILINDFCTLPFFNYLKQFSPSELSKKSVLLLLKLLRWIVKVTVPQGTPNPREASLVVPGWDGQQRLTTFVSGGIQTTTDRIVCTSTFWYMIMTTPLLLYQSLEAHLLSDPLSSSSNTTNENLITLSEESEFSADKPNNNNDGIQTHDTYSKNTDDDKSIIENNNNTLDYFLRYYITYGSELTLETPETIQLFKHNGFPANCAAIFVYLGNRKPEKYIEFLKSIGVLTCLNIRDIVGKLITLKEVVERDASKDESKKYASDQKDTTRPLTGHPRRLKYYIAALYRYLGGTLRIATLSKHSVDADATYVSQMFLKHKLLFISGRFFDPSAIVWAALDTEHRQDDQIAFLLEHVLKIPKQLSLKNLCNRYLKLQHQWIEWDHQKISINKSTLQDRYRILCELMRIFREMCFLIQENLASQTEKNDVFWPEALKEMWILTWIVKRVETPYTYHNDNKNKKTLSFFNVSPSLEHDITTAASQNDVLVLKPSNQLFYCIDLELLGLFKGTVDGIAYSDHDISIGSIEIYKRLHMLQYSDVSSMRHLIALHSNLSNDSSYSSSSDWDLDQIRAGILAQLLAKDFDTIQNLLPSKCLHAFLNPYIEIIECDLILQQTRFGIPQLSYLNSFLLNPKVNENNEMTVWFTIRKTVYFDPFGAEHPRLFWTRDAIKEDTQTDLHIIPILDSISNDFSIGMKTYDTVFRLLDMKQHNATPLITTKTSVFIIPQLYLHFSSFLGLPKKIMAFTNEAIDNMARSLFTETYTNFKQIIHALQTQKLCPESIDPQKWIALSKALDVSNITNRMDDSINTYDNNKYLFDYLRLYPLTINDNDKKLLQKNLSFMKYQEWTFLATNENAPYVTKFTELLQNSVERQQGLSYQCMYRSTKKTTDDDARRLILCEDKKFKKMEFSVLAGINTTRYKHMAIKQHILQMMHENKASHITRAALKQMDTTTQYFGPISYTYTTRKSPPFIKGIFIEYVKQTPMVVLRFSAPKKCLHLILNVKLLKSQDLPALLLRKEENGFDQHHENYLINNLQLDASVTEYRITQGLTLKASYQCQIGAKVKTCEDDNSDNSLTNVKEHTTETLWATSIITIKLPRPSWDIRMTSYCKLSNLITLAWHHIPNADTYLVCLACVPLNRGFLFWDLNILTHHTSLIFTPPFDFCNETAVFAAKVVALTHSDCINPQVIPDYINSSYLKYDDLVSYQQKEFLSNIENIPKDVIPLSWDNCIQTAIYKSSAVVPSSNYKKNLLQSNNKSTIVPRRIRPKVEKKKIDMKSIDSCNSTFRSDSSLVVVIFPRGYIHICTEISKIQEMSNEFVDHTYYQERNGDKKEPTVDNAQVSLDNLSSICNSIQFKRYVNFPIKNFFKQSYTFADILNIQYDKNTPSLFLIDPGYFCLHYAISQNDDSGLLSDLSNQNKNNDFFFQTLNKLFNNNIEGYVRLINHHASAALILKVSSTSWIIKRLYYSAENLIFHEHYNFFEKQSTIESLIAYNVVCEDQSDMMLLSLYPYIDTTRLINILHLPPTIYGTSDYYLENNNYDYTCQIILKEIVVKQSKIKNASYQNTLVNLSLEPLISSSSLETSASSLQLNWNTQHTLQNDESRKAQHNETSSLITFGVVYGNGCTLLPGIQQFINCNLPNNLEGHLQFVLHEAGVDHPTTSIYKNMNCEIETQYLQETTTELHLDNIAFGLGGSVCPGTTRCLIIGTPSIGRFVTTELTKANKTLSSKLFDTDHASQLMLPETVTYTFALANRKLLQTFYYYTATLLPECVICELLPSAHIFEPLSLMSHITFGGTHLLNLVALGYHIKFQVIHANDVYPSCLQRDRVVVVATRWDTFKKNLLNFSHQMFTSGKSTIIDNHRNDTSIQYSLLEIVGDLPSPDLNNTHYNGCQHQYFSDVNLPLTKMYQLAGQEFLTEIMSTPMHLQPWHFETPWEAPMSSLMTIIPADCFYATDTNFNETMSINNNSRCISIRENLRVLGLADSFHFCQITKNLEALRERYFHLVNAVPPQVINYLLNNALLMFDMNKNEKENEFCDMLIQTKPYSCNVLTDVLRKKRHAPNGNKDKKSSSNIELLTKFGTYSSMKTFQDKIKKNIKQVNIHTSLDDLQNVTLLTRGNTSTNLSDLRQSIVEVNHPITEEDMFFCPPSQYDDDHRKYKTTIQETKNKKGRNVTKMSKTSGR